MFWNKRCTYTTLNWNNKIQLKLQFESVKDGEQKGRTNPENNIIYLLRQGVIC